MGTRSPIGRFWCSVVTHPHNWVSCRLRLPIIRCTSKCDKSAGSRSHCFAVIDPLVQGKCSGFQKILRQYCGEGNIVLQEAHNVVCMIFTVQGQRARYPENMHVPDQDVSMRRKRDKSAAWSCSIYYTNTGAYNAAAHSAFLDCVVHRVAHSTCIIKDSL